MTNYYTGDPAIYVLRGGDGRVFYVGRTTRSIRARMYEHRYRVSFHPGPVYERWREHGKDVVTIEVLESGGDAEREAFWINKLLADGEPLVNQLSQDGVAESMSRESRDKIGRSNRGKDTWIKGKTGLEAGWTPERRAAQSARIKQINEARKSQ